LVTVSIGDDAIASQLGLLGVDIIIGPGGTLYASVVKQTLAFSNEQGDAGIMGRGTARGMVTVRFGMPERRIFPEDRGPK
jgi:hypothetical protein